MDVTLLKMAISTLNCVEVKGKDNFDRMLGCINALETIVQAEEAAQAKPAAAGVNGAHPPETANIDIPEADNG